MHTSADYKRWRLDSWLVYDVVWAAEIAGFGQYRGSRPYLGIQTGVLDLPGA